MAAYFQHSILWNMSTEMKKKLTHAYTHIANATKMTRKIKRKPNKPHYIADIAGTRAIFDCFNWGNFRFCVGPFFPPLHWQSKPNCAHAQRRKCISQNVGNCNFVISLVCFRWTLLKWDGNTELWVFVGLTLASIVVSKKHVNDGLNM